MKAAKSPATPDEWIEPKNLQFDPQNPRMPMMQFKTEADAVKFMVESFDVDELVRSILVTGWLDFEPLIVEEPTRVVLEGNRRLAALRLIESEQLRQDTGYTLPEIPDPKPLPEKILIRFVPDRKSARAFIGFKHVNGPVKWDAYAKARFAVEWLDDQGSLSEVSRALATITIRSGDSSTAGGYSSRQFDGVSTLTSAARDDSHFPISTPRSLGLRFVNSSGSRQTSPTFSPTTLCQPRGECN